jgi:hypothetical protein
MNFRVRPSFFVLLLVSAACIGPLRAQRAPNTNAYYQQLRNLLPAGDVFTIKDFVLQRDAAIFAFHSGSVQFYGPVNGKVTGAVFRGQGHLHITPPTPEERHNLAIFTHSDPVPSEEFDEDFDELILRFTDATAEMLRQSSKGSGPADPSYVKAAQGLQAFLRQHSERTMLEPPPSPPRPVLPQTPGQVVQPKPISVHAQRSYLVYFETLYENLDLRLLQDVLSPAPGDYFMAAIHGSKNPHLFYVDDPFGADRVAPEEIALLDWDNIRQTAAIPLAFSRTTGHESGAPRSSENNAAYTILREDLDIGVEKNGLLTAVAAVDIRANHDGLAVVLLDLYPGLRVSQVNSAENEPLDWIQEKKEEDSNLGVILRAPLQKGETTTVKISYSGKDLVINEGNGNYYLLPIAREDWYPNSHQRFGDYADYHMLFHIPRGLQVVATGNRVGESNDNKTVTSEWRTDTPLPAVGFNLGEFTMKEDTAPGKPGAGPAIDAYANTQPPDQYSDQVMHDQMPHYEATDNTDFGRYQSGAIDTTKLLPLQLSEARAASQIYVDYFGALPFAKIALTQQYPCNMGQSWPMLIYLPICSFMDQTQQIALQIPPWDMYWKAVTAHEVSHQWWGNTVGFRSYRDQWMSEGFAQASASIYLQLTRPKPDDFLHFWQVERQILTEKTGYGFRPIDVGPVTLGSRLNSPQTGWNVYQNLVYPKGAFILHMIRMMMWSPKDGDARFKATMHDFVNTHRLQAATTEDFKAIVEKHMSPGMDLEGNHTMDWFFREYVYGTDLPAYHFEGDATPSGEGWSVHFKLTQSGVDAHFANAVPIYLELADGKVMRMGQIAIHGPKTVEQTVQLPKLPAAIKKVSINYYYDVLCTDN